MGLLFVNLFVVWRRLTANLNHGRIVPEAGAATVVELEIAPPVNRDSIG